MENAFGYYPTQAELSAWLDGIWERAAGLEVQAETVAYDWPGRLGDFYTGIALKKFSLNGRRPFYGTWIGSIGRQNPLVVHLPGYGAELSYNPEIAAAGFNVLTLSPLGYWTPEGFDDSLRESKNAPWPVLPDTTESDGQSGYADWLTDVAAAVKWAWEQEMVIPGRVSFYGTSQGGGGSLLAASLFAGRGVRCVCADQPFLTNFPKAAWRGAYAIAKRSYNAQPDKAKAWHTLGLVDTLSHAPRIDVPVFLTSGGKDATCPPDTIDELYARLPGVKAKMFIPDATHGYQRQFIGLAAAWLRQYA